MVVNALLLYPTFFLIFLVDIDMSPPLLKLKLSEKTFSQLSIPQVKFSE